MKFILTLVFILSATQLLCQKNYFWDIEPAVRDDWGNIQLKIYSYNNSKHTFHFNWYYVSKENKLKIFSPHYLWYENTLDFISKYPEDSNGVIDCSQANLYLNNGIEYSLRDQKIVDTLWSYEPDDVNNILFSEWYSRYLRYKNNESTHPDETEIEYVNISNKHSINKFRIPKPREIFFVGLDSLYAFYNDELHIIKMETGAIINKVPSISYYYGTTNVSQDGKYFSVACPSYGYVHLFKIEQNESEEVYFDEGCFYNKAARFSMYKISYGKMDSLIYYDYSGDGLRYGQKLDHVIEYVEPTMRTLFFSNIVSPYSYNWESGDGSFYCYYIEQMLGATLIYNNDTLRCEAIIGGEETVLRVGYNGKILRTPYKKAYNNTTLFYNSKNFAFSNDGRYFAYYRTYEGSSQTNLSIIDLRVQLGFQTSLIESIIFQTIHPFEYISDVFFVDDKKVENDDKIIVCEMHGRITMYDLQGNQLKDKELPYKIIRGFQYNDEGTKILLVCVDEKRVTYIIEYDLADDTFVEIFRDNYDRFYNVTTVLKGEISLSSDYRYLALSASIQKMIFVIDLQNRNIIASATLHDKSFEPILIFSNKTNKIIYNDQDIKTLDYLKNSNVAYIKYNDYYYFDFHQNLNNKPFIHMMNHQFWDESIKVQCGDNIITLKTDLITSITDVKQIDDVSVYPNPANEYVNLKIGLATDVSNIYIYTVSSNQLSNEDYSYSVSGDLITLNLKSIPRGVYYVRLETSEGLLYRQFCKY